MKKKLLGIRIVLGLCAALGWWGLLYPALALTPDTVAVIEKSDIDTTPGPSVEWDFDGTLYRMLMEAGPEKITFRSRLFSDLSSLWEAIHNGDN